MNEEQPVAEPAAEEPSGPDRPDGDGWVPPEPTGIAAVDEALQSLQLLDSSPVSAHVEHYETVHRRLQDALADLDGS